MKTSSPQSKLLFSLASCLFLSSVSNASIVLTITELPDGKTNWQMTSTETPFVVGQFSLTGNYFEEILLPQNAFDFDYTAPFSIGFSAPIGRIRNITTGATTNLTGIRFSDLGGLRFQGGLMAHATGDSFEIVDLPAINVDVFFSDVLSTNPTVYAVNGAWHQVGQVQITPVPIPEPTTPLLVLFGCVIFGLRRVRKSEN